MIEKYTLEYFLYQAKLIHGDKYNYSMVKIDKWKSKVKIVCPVHGEFLQSPSQHINRQCGCPLCRWDKREKTCLKLYGVKNPFSSPEIMTEEVVQNRTQKIKESVYNKYNVKNISQLDSVKKKKEKTCEQHYGTKYYSQSEEGRKVLKEKISSKECQEKTRQTNLERYNTECTLNTEYARKNQKKALKSKEYSIKRKNLSKSISEKSWNTKKKNGTTSTSEFEKNFYSFLLENFKKEDVFKEYNRDKRYPYHCDFYIKSLDLFIELNIHWTHGEHWFNKNDKNDILLLKKWIQKSRSKPSYTTAINVWSNKDLQKYNCAKINNLNYIVLWNKHDINNFMLNIESIKGGNKILYENYRF